MTPGEFTRRHPNWRADVTDMISVFMQQMAADHSFDLLWSDDDLKMIEAAAVETTLEVFSPYREQMGDEIFGELVLLVGQEAKRLAALALCESSQIETLQ